DVEVWPVCGPVRRPGCGRDRRAAAFRASERLGAGRRACSTPCTSSLVGGVALPPVKVIIFGATGMIGQGVLRECLLDPRVDAVLVVGRASTGQHHGKLAEIVHRDLLDLSTVEGRFAGHDACFFCLGVASAGMSEEAYRRITYDMTMAAARSMARLNPD